MNDLNSRVGATMETAIILTSNLQEMADFYGQGLELGEAVPTGPDHLGFAMQNAYLGFDRVDDPRQPAVYYHYGSGLTTLKEPSNGLRI